MNQIKSFLKTHGRIYMPHLIREYGYSQGVYKEIMGYPIRFVNGMFILKHTDPELYIEAGPKYTRGRTVSWDKYEDIIHFAKNLEDMHMGVFAHDRSWVDNFRQTGSVSGGGRIVKAPVIWLDFDRSDPIAAYDDAEFIIKKRKLSDEEYGLYFSGSKGVHLALHAGLFAHPTGDQNIMCGRGKFFYNLAHKFSSVFDYDIDVYMMDKKTITELSGIKEPDLARKSLEIIDPNLYGINSTIRIPESLHEKTGERKRLVGGSPVQELIYTDVKPRFISMCDDAYQVKKKPRAHEYNTKVVAEDNMIDELYFAMFGEDYDPADADTNGYSGPFTNPFYNDTTPSLYVNINNGFFHDFGNQTDYSFPFFKAYSLWHKISERDAIRIIRQSYCENGE